MAAPVRAPVPVKREPGLSPPQKDPMSAPTAPAASGGVRVKTEGSPAQASGTSGLRQLVIPRFEPPQSPHGPGQPETPTPSGWRSEGHGGFAVPQTPRTARKHHHHHHHHHHGSRKHKSHGQEEHQRELRRHLLKVEELVDRTQSALADKGKQSHFGRDRLSELGWSDEELETEEDYLDFEDEWVVKDDDQCRAVTQHDRSEEGFFGKGMVGKNGCVWRWPRVYMLGSERRRKRVEPEESSVFAKPKKATEAPRKKARSEVGIEVLESAGRQLSGGRRPGGLLFGVAEDGCVPTVMESSSDSRVRPMEESGEVGYIDLDGVDEKSAEDAKHRLQMEGIGGVADAGGDVLDMLSSADDSSNLDFLDTVQSTEVEAEKSASASMFAAADESVLGPLAKISSGDGTESLFGPDVVQDDPGDPDFEHEPVDFLKLIDPRPMPDLESYQHRSMPPNGMAMIALQEGVLSFRDRMFEPAKVYNHDLRNAKELQLPHCLRIDSSESEWIFALKQKTESLAADGSMRQHVVQLRLLPHLHEDEMGEHVPWDHYHWRLRALPVQVRVEPECFVDMSKLTRVDFTHPARLGICVQAALRRVARHLRVLNMVWEEIAVLREAYDDVFVPEVGAGETEAAALTVRFICAIDHTMVDPRLKLHVPLMYPNVAPEYEFVGLAEGLESSAHFLRRFDHAAAHRLARTADARAAADTVSEFSGEGQRGAEQLCLAQVVGCWLQACADIAIAD